MPEKTSKSKEITKKCMVTQQSGMSFYTFIINSKELRDISYVSRRDMNNPQGYQRYLSESRLREVGKYIKSKIAVFPNNIIINFDINKAKFSPNTEDAMGIIKIKKEPDAAWVIDGQHRLWGFKYSDGKEFDLLVSAFIGLPIGGQATYFRTINSEQKGVSTSLIYDLIDLTKDADWTDTTLHELTKALNEDDDSPWKDQIKMVGVGPGIITQAGMIRELRKILHNEIFRECLVPEQLKMLKDYFTALKELFPAAWLNKKYILCKTIGLGSIILIMPRILTHCLLKNDFSKDSMREALSGLKHVSVPTPRGDFQDIDWSSNQLGAFSGAQGQAALAGILEQGLPKLLHTD